ncbi:MAG: hypothetical protein J6T35_07130 [Bacteroidales bacterium]|nr:hypothetical protein [Bacteroidales bacterium]
MKKIYLTFVLLVCCVLTLGAQAKIYTKKMKVADFTEKTLKVVLSGSEMTDGPFKSEVINHWKLSPYEFCTQDEFHTLKTDPNYYFMFIVGKNDELDHLEVVKGTKNPGEDLGKMLSVVSLPIRATGDKGIRYLAYLGAYLDFFQTFIADAMVNDIIGYSGLSRNALNARAIQGSTFLLADCDLASRRPDEELTARMEQAGVRVVSEEDATEALLNASASTLVSYCIRPVHTPRNKYYYTLLIGADDHKLYYCRKHYYVKDEDAGFSVFAIKNLLGKINK